MPEDLQKGDKVRKGMKTGTVHGFTELSDRGEVAKVLWEGQEARGYVAEDPDDLEKLQS